MSDLTRNPQLTGRLRARSEASELRPGFLRAMASVAGLSQAVAGLIEFAALDDGIVEPTVVEIPGQVLDEMIPDLGHQVGRAFGLVIDRAHDQGRRIHDRSE